MKWLQLRKERIDPVAERARDKKTDDLLHRLKFQVDRLETVSDELEHLVSKGDKK